MPPPVLFSKLGEGLARHAAGIVDQNVEPPEPCVRGSHCRFDLGCVHDIGGEGQGLSPQFGYPRRHFIAAFRHDIDNRHICAMRCQTDGNRPANPPTAAGDQRHLATEIKCTGIHGLFSPHVIRVGKVRRNIDVFRQCRTVDRFDRQP